MEVGKKNAWAWVPTLYMAEGLPYVVVNTLSVVMFKLMGMDNAAVAFYTSWLYLPWVIKPFWSPFVDIIKTNRWWVLLTQWILAIAFASVAFTLPTSNFFSMSLAAFWLMAFTSATHDIAADGFYMHGLNNEEQALFVGIRSTFYRIANILASGPLVLMAGWLEVRFGEVQKAWIAVFAMLSVFMALVSLYHTFVLPFPESDKNDKKMDASTVMNEFLETFILFFKKKRVWAAIAFIMLYRYPEAQMLKLIVPFLVDSKSAGGMGLSTIEVGTAYGTIGVIGMLAGGILGGIAIARYGLKKCLWPMAINMSITCLTFVYLAMNTDCNFWVVCACVCVEQFGYGFGITAFMVYLMYFVEGEKRTSHYAISTGFMAMGMMLPGMAAGWWQEQLGYLNFFIWTAACSVATYVACALVKIETKK